MLFCPSWRARAAVRLSLAATAALVAVASAWAGPVVGLPAAASATTGHGTASDGTPPLVTPTPGAPAPASEPGPVYVPPVAAPVTDRFRAPAAPWGAGNRGLEYVTTQGQPVRASADGEVVFAGMVAWHRHVTVQHEDGIRTSYSFLADIDVRVGQLLRRGDVVGRAQAGEFHFGARRGEVYIDPAGLFVHGQVRVELVPFEVPPGAGGPELSSGGWSWGALPNLSAPLRSALPPAVGHILVTDPPHERLHTAWEQLRHWSPVAPAAEVTWDVARNLMVRRECTDDEVTLGPADPGQGQGRRVALTVGGLGSSSESASVDRLALDTLGYEEDAVVRYSYTGEGRPYTSEDTQGDLTVQGAQLADAVERLARREPDAVVDIFAHSMGGVVALLALAELEERDFPLGRLGLTAAVGTPFQGADLATAVQVAGSRPSGRTGLALAERWLGTGLDPDSEAASQLATTSSLVAEVVEAGAPEGMAVVSVAARGDLVVPAPRAELSGARNVVVPEVGVEAHSDMVAAEETLRELHLALLDHPPRCVSQWDVVQDAVLGHGIAATQEATSQALLALP